MKLIDRISAHQLLNTLLNFILALVRLIVPTKSGRDKPTFPRWRKNKSDK